MLLAGTAAAIALAMPLTAAAQADHAAHHAATTAASADTAMTNGVVRRVDKAAGSVTIAHEALTNLKMPAMTMTFAVRKSGWLDGLKEGSRVRFVAQDVNGALTVVALEQVK